jgi:hypothetical protein
MRMRMTCQRNETSGLPSDASTMPGSGKPGTRFLPTLDQAILSLCRMVPEVGIEPTHLAVLDFESSASTSSTTRALPLRLARQKAFANNYPPRFGCPPRGAALGLFTFVLPFETTSPDRSRLTFTADASIMFLICAA